MRLNSSILAYNLGGHPFEDYYGTGFVIGCTDIFGNQGGDWTGSLAGQLGINNNVHVEPMLCDPMGSPANYAVMASSPVGNAFPCGALGALTAHLTWSRPVYGLEADGSGMFPTIQEAIDQAPESAVVKLRDGTYSGTGNRDLFMWPKRIDLIGNVSDPSLVVLDAQGSAADPHRAIVVASNSAFDPLLKGLTFTNGYAGGSDASGGAVFVPILADAKIEDCRFINNQATGSGAAIWGSGSSDLSINRCLFEGNTGLGAIAATDVQTTLRITDSTFDANTSNLMVTGTSTYASVRLQNCQLGDVGNSFGVHFADFATSDVLVTGCTLSVGPSRYALRVENCLRVNFGTSQFVTLNVNGQPQPQAWVSDSVADFLGCDFLGSGAVGSSNCAVQGNNSSMIYTTCTFTNFQDYSSYYGIVTQDGGSLVVDDCSFSQNRLPVMATNTTGIGVSITNSDFTNHLFGCLNVSATSAPVLVDGCQFTASGRHVTFNNVSDGTIQGCTFPTPLANETPLNFTTSNCVVSDCSITDSFVMFMGGGAIQSYDSNLTLNTCELLRNGTESLSGGGAIYQSGGVTTMTNCTLGENSSNSPGGAIKVENGQLSLYDSNLWGNHCDDKGGAILGDQSVISLDNCLLENNDGTQGGAIHATHGSIAALATTFRSNTATYGGAVSGYLAEMNLVSSDIVGNSADQHGGLYLNSCQPALVDHCLIAGNTSQERGSGIGVAGCSPVISNCTIVGNGGAGSAAQLYFEFTTAPVLQYDIIAFSTDGPAAASSAPETFTPEIGCCNVYGNTAGDWVGVLAGFGAVGNNISLEPSFCDPGAGDYHLAASSHCAAANNACGDDGGTYLGAFDVGCNSVTSVPELQELPRTFAVLGNFPNPFNPQTVISFELPADGPVTVAIYDMTGRLVRQLVGRESYPAGSHQVSWDGRDDGGQVQSSGLYLYRVTAEGTTLGGKMAMIR